MTDRARRDRRNERLSPASLRCRQAALNSRLQTSRIRFGTATVIPLALALSSCGIQGPIRPPRVERPEAVKDLKAAQTGLNFILTFTLPRLATDGERLTKPVSVEIFRWTGATLGAKAPRGAAPWKKLNAAELATDMRGNQVRIRLSVSASELAARAGTAYSFQVATLTHGFRGRQMVSALSNIARQTLIDVTPPPAELKVRATRNALILSWPPPLATLSGKPAANLTGYKVYTSETGAVGSFALAGESVEPNFRFSDFRFGKTYYFKVRAMFSAAGSKSESAASRVASVTPRNIYPPSPPVGLSAIYAANAVELIWQANSEPNLAGYNVYRREPGAAFVRLNKSVLRAPVFRDATVVPGRKYYYVVTAQDLTGNESALSSPVRIVAH